jgi:hypothetical protein
MPFSAASFDLSCLLHEFILQIALQKAMHFGGKYIHSLCGERVLADRPVAMEMM